LERLPRTKSANLYAVYTKFEKQHGTRTTLESTVLGKRRIQYEEELSHDGRNYDVWFDYARLEEGDYRQLREEGATAEEEEQAVARVREVYERAVAQVPPGNEKRHWRRYIFLWLDYALFEEIETKVCCQPPPPPYIVVADAASRISLEQGKYTRQPCGSYRINNLHLPSYG
jgi:crooked neck